MKIKKSMPKIEKVGENANIVYPNVENVQMLVDEIDNLLDKKEIIVIDLMSALVCIMIDTAQRYGLKKPTLLNYISNSWEKNSGD